jgi:nitrogen fixation protein FixH
MSAGAGRTPEGGPLRREVRGRGAWAWPLGLVLALVLSAASNIGFAVVASRDPSFAVEPDYYRRSLEWDRTMAQEDANRALGWSIAVRGERTPAQGQMRLVATLADGAGRPVEHAAVRVEARHGARAADLVRGDLAPVGPGRYVAVLPMGRAGVWELRFRAERSRDVYTQRVVADLPAGE